ncbi:MAG TPA: PIN domain-containing protein [Terriglobales bacterium]|nr:PIN domain-containing protein [Terriglobales bacterium]
MRPAVLADTGPLYAAADPDDAHHKRSRRELRRLADENYEIIVAYPTLLEAYTLVLFRLGETAAMRWLEEMAGAAPVNPSADDYRQAVVRVQSLKDQSITLFDALVASLAGRLGLEVWTYDHHFDVMRVAVWR